MRQADYEYEKKKNIYIKKIIVHGVFSLILKSYINQVCESVLVNCFSIIQNKIGHIK